MKQNASQSASGADLSDQMSVHIGNHLHFYLGCLLYPQDILNYKLTHGDTTLHYTAPSTHVPFKWTPKKNRNDLCFSLSAGVV